MGFFRFLGKALSSSPTVVKKGAGDAGRGKKGGIAVKAFQNAGQKAVRKARGTKK